MKDWERLSHSGRYDMRHLKEIMLLLIANDAPLPPEYRAQVGRHGARDRTLICYAKSQRSTP